jgi:hypothetical protein
MCRVTLNWRCTLETTSRVNTDRIQNQSKQQLNRVGVVFLVKPTMSSSQITDWAAPAAPLQQQQQQQQHSASSASSSTSASSVAAPL